MAYTDYYGCLKEKFNQTDQQIDIPEYNQQIINISYRSTGYYELPGVEPKIKGDELVRSFCEEEDRKIRYTDPQLNRLFDLPDTDAAENNDFKYILIRPAGSGKSDGLILMLHGLNEKKWEKYLTWAGTLQKLTGKSVILFPITFHMNRAPEAWSSSRLMNRVAEERKKLFDGLTASSFANAAISTRLYLKPQRFFFSGFQTYYDIMRLLNEIRTGSHPFFSREASVDMFGYSIGAFLSEILFIANHNTVLDNSRLILFCGGCTTDGFSPASKTIMDSAAYCSFRDFYAVNFEEEIKKNLIMRAFYKDPLPEAQAFRCMLNYERMRSFREDIFRKSSERIYALPLRKDLVIPPEEVKKTLNGKDLTIYSTVEIKDLPYQYTHETPFPVNPAQKNVVDNCFENILEKMAAFLS